jgi:hypothetical protein
MNFMRMIYEYVYCNRYLLVPRIIMTQAGYIP